MNISVIFHFLEELSVNNNREWFQQNKHKYEEARSEFEKLIASIISTISLFDEDIRSVEVKDTTYRIHRDIRFSADKTPYKTHLGAYINAKGKKSQHCGYYVHIEPGNCLLAGGSICPPPKLLKEIRRAIYENIDEYRLIVEDVEFKKYFPVIGDQFLKTAPKGFPADFEYIDYLKCKEYTCSYHVSDEFFSSPEVLTKVEDVFRQMKRFADFMNYTIDEFEESEE